ncbi:MAG: complex I NDUFA9 subunit family protein [Gammaproteobacteria bacterium]|nr:complex I NDUFA9 subunit family protein [Gammaproteobacteria bacterium]
MKIAITGGSGFVGRAITRQLQSTTDNQVIWLSSRQLKQSDEFPNITIKMVDYHNTDSLSSALIGCDVVIHLVGILHEPKTATFDEIHHQLPQKVLSACTDSGVSRYLHMSALGIGNNAPSQYLQSKYRGEQACFALAKQNGITMLSFRPSIIFGEEDNFFNQFARLLKFSPVFPVVCPNATFQPVSVTDVAKAFIWGLENGTNGKTYELVGKEVITMQQAITKVCQHYGWKRLLIPLPDSISRLQGKLLNHIPNAPFTYDSYLSLQQPNVSKRWDWQAIGVKPLPITIG